MIDVFERIWKCKSMRDDMAVGHNLFIFYFCDGDDRQWVLKKGPWNFDEVLLNLKKYCLGMIPREVSLS